MRNYTKLEIEKSILGHIIFDNRKADEIKIIKPYHFSDSRNRKLFESVLKLRNEDRVIDYVSLFEETKIEPAYISSLIGYDTFGFLEPILLESYIKRQIQNTANEVLNKDFDEVDIFEETENLISKLEHFTEIQRTPDNSKILENVIDEIITDRNSKTERLLKFTSLPSINKYVGGINDTDLIGIYGKEKSTKTTLAVRMVLDVVLQGKSAAIFSYEIDEKEMYQKILSLLTGISQTKIRNPKGFSSDTRLTDSELEELKQKADELKTLNLSIFAAQQSELDIQSICRNLKKKGLDLIVIDYLLLIETYKKYPNYRERINDLTRFFKLMANRLHIPIILISQANESGDRAAEGKGLERDSNYFFYVQSVDDLIKRGTKVLEFYDNIIGYYRYELQPNDYVVQLRKARHTEGSKYFIANYANGKYSERETRPIMESLPI